MRWKAERKIREAAAELDGGNGYRVDRVREGAGLLRKVFDKTLLDMARVGSIEFTSGIRPDMSDAEKNNRIRGDAGGEIRFRFTTAVSEMDAVSTTHPEAPVSETAPENTASRPEPGSSEATDVRDAEPPEDHAPPDIVNILIRGIDRQDWERFSHRCRHVEHMGPGKKLKAMIRAYLSNHS